MKLISMVDFVLQKRINGTGTVATVLNSIFKYADFLNTPLHPSQFVAMDDDGNVLEEVSNDENGHGHISEEWKQAQSKVLFDGFVYDEKMEYWHNGEISMDEEFILNKTISDLIPYDLTLNNNGKKLNGV